MIGFNLIHSSLKNNVKKFINLGSVSNYPKNKNSNQGKLFINLIS